MTHVGIWGAGREGLAAARRYLANGHTVTVVSEADAPRPAALPADAVFYGGPAALSHLREADLVVISPGVPRVHPFRAELRDIPQTSVTDAWLASHADHTIGVTGTKGKSTTSTLVHALLTAAGVQARLGGNIGVPLMGLGDSPEPTVAELSSYQCASITRSPRIAVVTNLFEDHLTWHGSREAYWRDKARIFDHGACLLVCTPETARQFTALGYTLPPLRTPGAADHARIAPLALPEPLARPHNRANLVLALCAAEAWLGAELAPDVLVAACAAYEPAAPPHPRPRNRPCTLDRRHPLDDGSERDCSAQRRTGSARDDRGRP